MSRLFKSATIGSKLMLLTLLASSVALLLAAGIYTVYQLAVLRHELVEDISVLADVVAAHGRRALIEGESGYVDQTLASLREEKGLVSVHVFSSEGRSVAGFGRPATEAVFRDGFEERALHSIDGRHLVLTRPIIADGQPLGVVLVESDLGRVYRRLTQEGLVGAAVMLLSFAAALALTFRLRRTIVEPIEALSATASRAASAQLLEPRAGGGDDLQRLTHAFEGLVDAVRSRDDRLRESEHRYRALVENAGDAVFLLDEHGGVVDVNREACLTLGYERDELLERRAADLLEDGGQRGMPAEWRGVAEDEPATLRVRHRRKDGSGYSAEVRLARYRQDGRSLLLALSRDVSRHEQVTRELERARHAAEAADRAKSRFLASINHEIRTPMTSVVAMAELLERSVLGPEQHRYVQIARSSANSLLAVIDDILELSWSDSGRLSLDSLAFEIEPLLDDVIELFAQRAREKGIELTSLIAHGVPRHLRGDPRHLRQILINLVGNAVKFTEQGDIEVQITASGDASEGRVPLCFTVRDTGIGIPKELHHDLFEPFVQLDHSSTRRHGGAGIGLTISRALVELMDGHIGVESTPEAGSTFCFEVALETLAQEQAPATDFAGVRALLVDGNGAVRRTVGAQMEQLGLEVTVVDNAARCADLLERAKDEGRPFSLLLAGLDARDGSASEARVRALLERAREPALGAPHRVLLAPLGDAMSGALPAAVEARLTKPVRQSGLGVFLGAVLRGETPSPAPADASPRTPTSDSAAQRGRVLVVDDDAAIRTSMSLVLDVLGYTAVAVENGREAVEALEDSAYDAVLMDCQMPVMDGFDAARAIRHFEPEGRHVPIIGMTGYVQEGERERCLEAGMDEHLAKPVSITMLESLLAHYVKRRVPC
jgi:PAS domain S-box-containing protein